MQEPNDSHTYGAIWLRARTVALIRKGFAFYQSLLEADLAALKADPELVAVIDDVDSLPIAQEAARIGRIGAWLDEKVAEQGTTFGDRALSLSHEYVRLTKSVCLLCIQQLRRRRDALGRRPGASTHLLGSVDAALASLEESMESGVFKGATASPLLAANVGAPEPLVSTASAALRPTSTSAIPLLLPSIELLDVELRSRCVDLFAHFSGDDQHDRLDTVITEATRILEDRLRRVSGAPNTTVGVELATFALSGARPRIRVSSVQAEQEAAHLLFRGLFGFIRNHVHHRLTGRLIPQRVLQILGMVDYLISLSAGAGLAADAGDAGESV